MTPSAVPACGQAGRAWAESSPGAGANFCFKLGQ